MRTKIKMLLSAILCFVFVFSFVACGDKGSAEKPTLTITSKEQTIEIGEKYMLEYTVDHAETVTVTVTEKSGKESGRYNETSREFTATETGIYTLTVKAVNEAGSVEKSVVVTVKEAEKPADTTAPVITIQDKEKERIVKVGESLTLPTVTASDDTDGDLTSAVEVGMATSPRGVELKKGENGNYTFKAQVAGEHKISYYVEDKAENYDEQFIDVTVTPAKAETVLSEGENDISNLAKDNVKFTENFEEGYNGSFAKGLTYDTIVPASISGGEDAIAGNSLILDYENCVATSDTKFYFGAVQDYIKTGKWTVSLDVKVIEGNLPDNKIYLFFVQEGQTEAQGIPYEVKTNGDVTHIEYSAIKVFDTSKPWYMGFFTYTGNTSFQYNGLRLAMDNISLTREVVEDATVIRTQPAKTITADDLDGSGYTFTGDDDNYSDVIGSSGAIYLQKDKLVGGKYLTEEQFKNITPENGFNGSTVVFTTGQQTGFLSVKDLCIDPAYDYTLTLKVYLPADISGWHWWQSTDANMQVGGNSLGQLSGDQCKAGVHTWTLKVQGNAKNINLGLYSGNQNTVFIGDVTISRSAHETAQKTPNGYAVGHTWTLTAKDKPGDFNNVSNVVPSEITLSDGTKLSEKEGFTDSALQFNKSDNKTGEMFRLNKICETGCIYKITFTMYVETVTGSLMANFDNQKFPVLTEKTGLQTVSITNEGLIDFFSLYVAGGASANVYVASVTIELIEIK